MEKIGGCCSVARQEEANARAEVQRVRAERARSEAAVA